MKKIENKIGNIITTGSGKKFPKIFNIVKDLGGIDASLPTLIIGLQESKAILGRKFSIIERRLNHKLWWTYKKTERNCEYESDTVEFYRHCLTMMLSSIFCTSSTKDGQGFKNSLATNFTSPLMVTFSYLLNL